jgi:addiction module HigA family antidote
MARAAEEERGFLSITRKGTPNWKIHPGEILRHEFLEPMNMSVYRLAKQLHVPAPRVNDIILQKRGITADTAVRLAKFFGTSAVLARAAGSLRS